MNAYLDGSFLRGFGCCFVFYFLFSKLYFFFFWLTQGLFLLCCEFSEILSLIVFDGGRYGFILRYFHQDLDNLV